MDADKDNRTKRDKEYTIDPKLMQSFIDSIDTNELTDPQKCGHILEFFKQQKIIKIISFRPQDQFHRDGNAATTEKGGSIDFSGAERQGGPGQQ